MSFPLPPDWPTDVSSTEYGRYLYAYFNGAAAPPHRTAGADRENQCVKNPKAGSAIMRHQLVINMALRGGVRNPQRGILCWHSTGSGKCHGADTEILMFDGSIKMVQDVRVGDVLMGDDSTPRRVLSLATGEDELYDVTSPEDEGVGYTVNAAHILCLRRERDEAQQDVQEMPTTDYLRLPEAERRALRGYRVSVSSFGRTSNGRSALTTLLLTEQLDGALQRGDGLPASVKCGPRAVRQQALDHLTGAGTGAPGSFTHPSPALRADVAFVARSLGYAARRCARDPMTVVVGTRATTAYELRLTPRGRGAYYGFTLDGNRRYLLGDFSVTHNTVTSTGVLDAYWDDASKRRMVYATSVDALAANPPVNFHANALKLFPRFKGKSMENVAEMFRKRRVEFLSFAQLAHQLGVHQATKGADADFLRDGVLIIDEVHSIFKPLPNQRAEHDALRRFLLDVGNPHTSGMKVVVLTATPGDTVEHIVQLLNMLRDPAKPVIAVDPSDLEAFKRSIRGLVSFYDTASDVGAFPRLLEAPTVRVPLSMQQFVKYLDAYQKDVDQRQDYDALQREDQLQKYYAGSRKYSNMLYNYDKDALEQGQFSAKLPALLENIQKYPMQKHYVYSSFYERRGSSQGILAIAQALEDELGYVKLTLAEAQAGWRDRTPPVRRYVLLTPAEVAPDGPTRKSRETVLNLVRAFNDAKNRRGAHAHVLLASASFNQGIDLRAVRHIHLFEPFLTHGAELQALGRGRRYCSHDDLAFDREWTVTVHRYLSDMPMELSVATPEELHRRLEAYREQERQQRERAQELQAAYEAASKADHRRRTRLLDGIMSARAAADAAHDMASDVAWKEQARKLKMVDDLVLEEAERRSSELLAVYRAMKEAAFDCPLYSAMHGVRCMD